MAQEAAQECTVVQVLGLIGGYLLDIEGFAAWLNSVRDW